MSTPTLIVAYDSGELAAPATSLTISGLNGDVDEEYELIIRDVGGNAGGSTVQIRPNNDTGTNYGQQYLFGSGTSTSAARGTHDVFNCQWALGTAQNNVSFGIFKLKAKSGYVRTLIQKTVENISGTTVGSIDIVGQSWNNTADNITSLVVLSAAANGLGIGSRVILLKKSSSATTKTWEEIYTHTVTGSAVTSLTIPSLTGNSDVLYRLRARVVNGASGGTTFQLRPNNDSGANYGSQYLAGVNTTASAFRGTGTVLNLGYADDINYLAQTEVLLYAKSGFVRTSIGEDSRGITGTTITGTYLRGQVYNETTTEITSLVILADQSNGIGIGSSCSLERLNL